MLGFAFSFHPVSPSTTLLSRSSITPRNVLPTPSKSTSTGSRAVVTMRKSIAMPFMEAPAPLDGSMVGDVGFDPFGLSEIFDIRFLREAELKHCRIAMLAMLGIFVQELVTLPWPYFKPLLAADAHAYFVKTGGMGQILLFCGFFEIFGALALKETLDGNREPGDFGFDPLNLSRGNKEKFNRYRLSELKNGRLAMMAVGGAIHYEWIAKQSTVSSLTNFHAIPVHF